MPNWCTTSYVVTGNTETTKKFHAVLTRLTEKKSSLVKNDFGKLWLGNICELLRRSWKSIHCRGVIDRFDLDPDGTLRLEVTSAWGEMMEVRNLLLEKYPDLSVFYISEEPGNLYFFKNDYSGKYFPETYLLQYGDQRNSTYVYERFNTIGDVAAFLSEEVFPGTEIGPTRKAVIDVLEKAEKESSDDVYFSLNEFQLTDD